MEWSTHLPLVGGGGVSDFFVGSLVKAYDFGL